MTDVHTPEKRSYNMSHIHGKDTKPEEIVRKYLFSHGLRYRKNDSRLPGKPDIVFPGCKAVVFVNGCFWHKHEGCKYFVWPKSHVDFWKEKILSNVARDQRNYQALKDQGWTVFVIWECELKKNVAEKNLSALLQKLTYLRNSTIR